MSAALNLVHEGDGSIEPIRALMNAVVGKGDGYVVISKTSDPNWKGLKSKSIPANDFNAVMEEVRNCKADEQVLFGLGRRRSTSDSGKRGGNSDVSHISVIGMDIDLYDSNKPHKKLPKTKQEGILLLNGYELPPSMIVNSGSGLHAYWFLSDEIVIEDEAALKAAQKTIKNFYRGFGAYSAPYEFDATHDLSRGLRLPGTNNLKDISNPVQVTVLEVDETRKYSVAQIEAAGVDYEPKVVTNVAIVHKGNLNLEMVQDGCHWFNRVWTNPSTTSYSNWFAVASVLYFADNGNALFHEWSAKYPNYDPDESQRLWDGIDPEKARRTCESLEALPNESNECLSCPFKGGVRSPIELGYPGKRHVVTKVGDLPSKVAQVWAGVFTNNKPERLFRNEAGILRINPGKVTWEVLNAKSLRYESSRMVSWVKPKDDGLTPADPQEMVIDDMLQTVEAPLPYLKKVTSIPVITSDGRLVSKYFYDKESQIYRVISADLENIEYGSGKYFANVSDAVSFILDDCLHDFPFQGEQDKAHALALMLHDFARNLFTGASPLFLIDKPIHGTGASLLANTLCYPALGEDVPTKNFTKNDEELRKQVTAHLVGGGGPNLLDNISGSDIDSDVLAMVLTSSKYGDRLLGSNTEVRLENLGPWIGTGNNPSFSGQLTRRFIRIRLVPLEEDPYNRSEFLHYPLTPWVAANRSKLVDACITIVMAWVKAGKPLFTGTPLGSFESFSQVMGGILENAGVPGFMSNLNFQREGMDGETEQIRMLVQKWWEDYANTPVSAKNIVALSNKYELEIQDRWGESSEQSKWTRAGKFIRTQKERFFKITDEDGSEVKVQIVADSRNTYRLTKSDTRIS